MTNAADRPVLIVDYDPLWPAQFQAERVRLMEKISAPAEAIEHIGSTAVPGLAAKPTIDILGVLDRPLAQFEIDALCRRGYFYHEDGGIPGRQFFTQTEPGSIHLHCFVKGNPEIDRHLGFRDYLRDRPDVAAAYADLKRRLARQFLTDRRAYTDGKSDFIRAIDELVRAELD